MLPIAVVPKAYTLAFTSDLDAPVEAVWEVVGTMAGVNEELGPWLRMTAPPESANMRIEDAPVGQPLFTSWVLLGQPRVQRAKFSSSAASARPLIVEPRDARASPPSRIAWSSPRSARRSSTSPGIATSGAVLNTTVSRAIATSSVSASIWVQTVVQIERSTPLFEPRGTMSKLL